MITEKPVLLPDSILKEYVKRYFLSKHKFIKAWERAGKQPAYVLDLPALYKQAERFMTTFRNVLNNTDFYYAVKSNNNPDIVKVLSEIGFGLDVSSGQELQLAIDVGSGKIAFTGPGKTESELNLALKHNDKVVILMDSFSELERLKKLSESSRKEIQAGVRISHATTGTWQKFGIPITDLKNFWRLAHKHPYLKLSGIHFHTSWNMNPSRQLKMIEEIGNVISDWEFASEIKFLDIGGGFWPPRGEWLQHQPPENKKLNKQNESSDHFLVPSLSINSFAREISNCIKKHIFPKSKCKICLEPGRWISSDAMHLMMSVSDKKTNNLVITDAGTNAVGWERYEHYYAPILNLSSPEISEKKCQILGSLCTPEDIWGYNYWGKDISTGDVLLIPDQGSYTYSLRQQFIKPLPTVIRLDYA